MFWLIDRSDNFYTGGKTMKFRLTILLIALGMILPGLLPAAEIVTEEDIMKKVVVEENFIKLSSIIFKNLNHS